MVDLIVHNAHILTQYEHLPVARAFAVANKKFVAVSNHEEELLSLAQPTTRIVDAQGQTIVPGFIDAHIHLWKVGSLLTHQLNLHGVFSIEELQQKILDFARQHPELPWIIARGFNEALFAEQRMPNRFDLDKVVAERPVIAVRVCAHQLVANSRALQIAGITSQTVSPFGGAIGQAADGTPDGRLIETAMGLMWKHMPSYTSLDYQKMILAAQQYLLKQGVTAVADPAVAPDVLEVYESMERNGELALRVNAIAIRLPDGETTALPLPKPCQKPYLQVDTVKFFADGGISGRTAALLKPYPNTTSCGILRLAKPQFLQLAQEAQAAGFRIATHAIGDAATQLVCDVYEALWQTFSLPRNRMEHVGLVTPENLSQLCRVKACAVMQPVFLYELSSNFRLYLNDDRLERLYPFRSVWNSGIALALSTDAPVVRNTNPLIGMQAATDRTPPGQPPIGPEETLTPEQALFAYTMGSAWANATEQINGSISVGKFADFVILSRSPLHKLKETQVMATYVDGLPVC